MSSHLLISRDTSDRLDLTPDQRTRTIVACVYIPIIIILWNVPILKLLLYPFKLLTVAFHEFSHAFVGLLTCAKIESVQLDPDEGGATRMRGGIPWLTLPAGYLGSSFIGAALIACGYDLEASKIATFVLAVIFLMSLWWARRNWLTWVLLIVMAGLIVAFWFIAHAVALPYLVLFIGVMSSLYSVWDIMDDLIFRKVNESDASAFSRLVGGPPQAWGAFWLIISVGFFACGILVGIVAFKTPVSVQADSTFLDTRSFLQTMLL